MIKEPKQLKKKAFHIAAFLLMYPFALLFSQYGNLVINPSFEEKIDFGSPDAKASWTKCLKNDTPDYITFTDRGEPDFYYRKYIGGLLPYDGNAYVGLFCFRVHPLNGIENVREFIQAPLSDKLQKDTLYTVSFHVALDPESNTAINNFNIYFTEEVISKKREKEMYELYPLVRFMRSFYDSTSWMQLETQYKAKGDEVQIVIGNFLSDKSTGKKKVTFESEMQPKWNLHELEKVAYYYVDKVCVVKASETKAAEKDQAVFSNPNPEAEEVPDTKFLEITRMRQDSSVVLNHIFFAFDESILLPESYKELDHLFDQLQQFNKFKIIIEGHTDNLGTYEYNIQLSLERAMAVAEYLLGKGLEEERISFEGYGYTRPLSDNRTEEGRQLNRRVAFRISDASERETKK